MSGLDPGSLPEVPKRLPDDATVREFLVATIGASTRQLLINDPGVRLGADPESIHRARVATRRLRSDLASFGALMADDATDGLRSELSWLGALLGEVRDPQVLEGRLMEQAAWLDDGADGSATVDHATVAEVTDVLVERAAFHHTQLLSAMNGDRYRDLVTELVRMSQQPTVASPELGSTPAAPVARRLARRQWKRARRFARGLTEPDDLEIHEVRKRLKRARYAAQSVRRIGIGNKSFRRGLADLQDRLGDHHDLVVQREFLAADIRRLGPDAAFLAGRLLQDADHRRQAVRADWQEVADGLDRLEFD